MNMYRQIEENVALRLKELGVSYSAQFVPQSISRNRDKEDKSINWMATFRKKDNSYSCEYMQGIGHTPGYKALPRNYDDKRENTEREKYAAEKGQTFKRMASWGPHGFSNLPAPTAASVLHCLLSDASVLNYRTFEEWAREYGYDTDSRTAEATYRACIAAAMGLRAVLDDKEQEGLQELLQDY